MHRRAFASAWNASLRIYDPVNSAERVAAIVGGQIAANIRVRDVIRFLGHRWGKPDSIAKYPPPNGGELSGRKGVVLFEVRGWDDAAGHATLWNGSQCYDHCYFNEPGANYRTDRASFWALP